MNQDSAKTWSELPIENRIGYVLSVCSFTLGYCMIFISMLINDNHGVHPSILSAFGISLTFCGAVLGISLKYENSLSKFKEEIRSQLKDKT